MEPSGPVIGFDSTYEGLKPWPSAVPYSAPAGFDSTYEGLKLARVPPHPARTAAGFDSTYEGLKRARGAAGPRGAKSFDSTYEGLKQFTADASAPKLTFRQYL